MKLLQILAESLPDIVYHFTSNIIGILENNKINLSTALGSTADLNINKGKFNFLSTTRSKSSGFKTGNAKIVLDGRKLNYHYKSIPVDYWQYSKSPNDYNQSNYINALSSEQEDRIISDKLSIPNFNKYILAIHIYNNNLKSSHKIKELANKNNIPVFFYNGEKDWLNQKNSIELENLPPKSDEDEYSSKFSMSKYREYDLASLIAYNNPENYKKIIEHINDDNEKKKFDEILDDRKNNWLSIRAPYKDDAIRVIMEIIHRSRTFKNPEIDFLLNLLIKEMRKLKVTTIKDYIEEKSWIGKKNINYFKKELISHLISTINNNVQNKINYKLQLDNWVEIDGTYYNKAYESPEIIKFIKTYVDNIKKYIINQITNENERLDRIYKLDSDYIRIFIDLDNIKLNFNITDKNERLDLKQDIKDILKYITVVISREYSEKSEELMKEYYKQF